MISRRLQGLKESQAAAQAAQDFPVYQNAEARAVIEKFYNNNVPVLDTGARGATVTFAQKQLGDVLLNWENELWLALDEFGKDKFEIVYPSSSILGEPPVAVVDEVVDKKGTRDCRGSLFEISLHVRGAGERWRNCITGRATSRP